MGFGVVLMINWVLGAVIFILSWWAGLVVGYLLRCWDEFREKKLTGDDDVCPISFVGYLDGDKINKEK